MYYWKRPDDQQMLQLVENGASADFTYQELGATHDGGRPPGYEIGCYRVRLGEGIDCFRAACEAMTQWRMVPPYIDLFPASPPWDADQCVALRMQACGLWVAILCRIVYTMDIVLPMGGLRFGFGYGTLAGHVARGEERFLVELMPDDGVWYEAYSFSRPANWIVWLGRPVMRYFQRRFGMDSCQAMRRAIDAETTDA